MDDVLLGASTGFSAIGSLASAFEYSSVRGGMWQGANGKWYPMRWNGNQYTGPRSFAQSNARFATSIGRTMFFAGAALSAAQGLNALSNGDTRAAGKSAVDIGMSYVGTYGGPWGAAAGATYWITDTAVNLTVGWEPIEGYLVESVGMNPAGAGVLMSQ